MFWGFDKVVIRAVVLFVALSAFVADVSYAKNNIPIEYYDLSEISLLSTSPARSGGSAVFSDPTGKKHRVKVGKPVANLFYSLQSVQAGKVTISEMAEDINGDWIDVPRFHWEVNGQPITLPPPAWFTPPPDSEIPLMVRGQWPESLHDAVRMIISRLSAEDRLLVKATSKSDLYKFHLGWGMGIRNYYGLWRGNTKLILSACGKPCHPDNASSVIISAVWEELQK